MMLSRVRRGVGAAQAEQQDGHTGLALALSMAWANHATDYVIARLE